MKSSEVSTKTRSPPASFSFKGQATKYTTVKWSIVKVAKKLPSRMPREVAAVGSTKKQLLCVQWT